MLKIVCVVLNAMNTNKKPQPMITMRQLPSFSGDVPMLYQNARDATRCALSHRVRGS